MNTRVTVISKYYFGILLENDFRLNRNVKMLMFITALDFIFKRLHFPTKVSKLLPKTKSSLECSEGIVIGEGGAEGVEVPVGEASVGHAEGLQHRAVPHSTEQPAQGVVRHVLQQAGRGYET